MGGFPDALPSRHGAYCLHDPIREGRLIESMRWYLMPGARKDTTPITRESPDYVGRAATLGDYTVTFETLRGGMDPAPFFKGLPDDRCPCPHWGVVTSGRLTLRY